MTDQDGITKRAKRVMKHDTLLPVFLFKSFKKCLLTSYLYHLRPVLSRNFPYFSVSRIHICEKIPIILQSIVIFGKKIRKRSCTKGYSLPLAKIERESRHKCFIHCAQKKGTFFFIFSQDLQSNICIYQVPFWKKFLI